MELKISNNPNAGDVLVGYKGQYIWIRPEIIYEAYKSGIIAYQEKLEELIEEILK